MQLPAAYLLRIRSQLGDGFDGYLAAMRAPATRALRVNTLKTDPLSLCARLPFLKPTGLVPEGFFVPDSFMPSREPLHAAGLFYMQEPTAQLPAALLPLGESETPVVLDLCASPGGKASFLAARMQNRGLLIANEPVPARAETLCRTFERLGVTNAVVTCMKPEPLCAFLANRCDAVLVDAPCSGEGMFRKDARAILEWSPGHVRACALRQRGILNAAATAVRGGGALVYSTCTFSEAENEGVVDELLAREPAFRFERFLRLYPHTSCGEGQCMALLQKRGTGSPRAEDAQKRARYAAAVIKPESCRCEPFARFCDQYLTEPPRRAVRVLADGRVLLLPELMPDSLAPLNVRSAGILAGEIRAGRFIPANALFLALPASYFRFRISPDETALAAYFAGEEIACDAALSGYCAVCAAGYPAGFGKAVSGRLKNHYPKGQRIR